MQYSIVSLKKKKRNSLNNIIYSSWKTSDIVQETIDIETPLNVIQCNFIRIMCAIVIMFVIIPSCLFDVKNITH